MGYQGGSVSATGFGIDSGNSVCSHHLVRFDFAGNGYMSSGQLFFTVYDEDSGSFSEPLSTFASGTSLPSAI